MKKRIRYLIDQHTNHGRVKAGDEKMVDADIAEIEVKRGLAEYVGESTPSYKNWNTPRETIRPVSVMLYEDKKDLGEVESKSAIKRKNPFQRNIHPR